MILTFLSGVKGNKWISLLSGDFEPLRKASIISLLDSVSEIIEIEVSASICWSFDNSGDKNGYKLTFTINDGKSEPIEVYPTTKYPFTEQRIFRTFEAAERFCVSLGLDCIRVDFG